MDAKQWQLLKNDYVRRLRTYLSELTLFERNFVQPFASEHLKNIENVAHRLAGSGAAYGFTELSVKAKTLELLLRGLQDDVFAQSHSAVHEALANLIQHMNSCIASSAGALDESVLQTTVEDLDAPVTPCPTVLVVDDDPAIGIDLTASLFEEGFDVRVVQDINKLGEVIAATNPLAVVCDLIFPEGNLAGVEYFKSITENRLPPIPAIFMSSNQDFDARLACARAGGSHFFSKPLDKISLVRSLRELVGLKSNDPYRILLVDDDENLLQLYGETLELAGYKVFRALSARQGLDFLINEDPEMILLDIHLEGCSGLELGKVIRQHERFAYTPLMFMSSDTRADVQMAAVRLAGDDFISKPIEPWRLLMTVEPRVKRSRLIHNPAVSRSGMAHKGDVYDPLTALPNLRYLRSIVDEKLAPENEKVQLCLVKIDIDDFHHVNDVCGHYQADRMLQQIAWEISHCLHFEDILSRESGDEFYVLLVSPVSVINQKTIIKNITNAIAKIKVSYGDNLRLTISVGVALAPQDSRNAVDLIAHTDTALFHAKAKVSDRVCYFDACVQETLLHQFKLENDVRHIIERNQLLAYYQPIFNVTDMRLTGFEALVRWQHPQRGIVAPDQFIYAVEKQGLMPQLTEWMLDHAMEQQAIWQTQGHNSIMHVNITAIDVQNVHFVDLVQSLLLKHSINPAQLMLELTESTLMKNWDMGGKLLRSLRELGVKLAIDDFGTGYSSLSYLNRFPVDKLKIDRSFLNDWSVQKDERLISAIISLSKAMGFGVVAEGVEEAQQLAFLKDLGCDEFQGYFVSKPLVVNEIANAVWFKAN